MQYIEFWCKTQYELSISSCSVKPSETHVGRTLVRALTGLVVLPITQMPLCHHAAVQHVTAVQHRLLKSSQSINQRGPDVFQQLTEGKHGMSSQRGSIFHVGQHLPLQLLRLGFHLTASTRLQHREKHLDRSCWKPTSTSEVVRLTYGSGRRQEEDLYMVKLLWAVRAWWQLWRWLIWTNGWHTWPGVVQLGMSRYKKVSS